MTIIADRLGATRTMTLPWSIAVIFKIPDIELSVFTIAALKDMQAQATTEYNTLVASVKSDATFATDSRLRVPGGSACRSR